MSTPAWQVCAYGAVAWEVQGPPGAPLVHVGLVAERRRESLTTDPLARKHAPDADREAARLVAGRDAAREMAERIAAALNAERRA